MNFLNDIIAPYIILDTNIVSTCICSFCSVDLSVCWSTHLSNFTLGKSMNVMDMWSQNNTSKPLPSSQKLFPFANELLCLRRGVQFSLNFESGDGKCIIQIWNPGAFTHVNKQSSILAEKLIKHKVHDCWTIWYWKKLERKHLNVLLAPYQILYLAQPSQGQSMYRAAPSEYDWQMNSATVQRESRSKSSAVRA